jgi:hypothetical protein
LHACSSCCAPLNGFLHSFQRHSSLTRRSESAESDRYPVEKSKKKKKKDKKEYPSDDERRSVSKSKHTRADKEEKKAAYDPVDMDISDDNDDKRKQR